ncbi:MAG: reverse transcriptase family protein, partial [Candidatus Thiodiazotropha taylori]|nr:reverse transcriptase family protein [Candidatus Thiodiazotropha taylori]MCW4282605.1 reverse transcriptase family protein [Candidatus Thiodiazotropha taylori]
SVNTYGEWETFLPNHETETINNEINSPITENEIIKAIRSLKNNKSPGIDEIKNEHIKSSLEYLLPIYHKLFNLIFDKGIIPESWLIGNILPIYKNKGDSHNPENYRPITLLSCLGKVFTSILNNRLNQYAEDHEVLTDCQAGFRKGYSTADNLFIINSLVEMFKAKHNKLFCTFIDFKQAFDTVWRDGLWYKLKRYNINGKCHNLIQNLYNNIKSRIYTSDGTSAFFPCTQGVRQGENLSPFLFSIFLNDLENHFTVCKQKGITCDFNDENTSIFLKLFILLYADDTVIFSDNPKDMQNALYTFQDYCKTWKLKVNASKTKVLIISQGRTPRNLHFHLDGTELDIVKEYKYLGIYLSSSGSFQTAKKYIAEQGNKALFSMIKKCRNLNLPFDIQIELFDKTIKPILLYGCEVWGFGNCDIIERVQLKFYKYIFNLKRSTPSFMIYGELGITPIRVDIKTRITSYWTKLVSMVDSNQMLSSKVYEILYLMHKSNLCKSNYIENIKNIVEGCGFSGIWQSQDVINNKWFKVSLAQRIKDQYLQERSCTINSSSCGLNYRLFKEVPQQSKYIKNLSNYYCKILIAFRTRNHKLPIELGRWSSVHLRTEFVIYASPILGTSFTTSCPVLTLTTHDDVI